jgi:FAD:protein FMN transferase
VKTVFLAVVFLAACITGSPVHGDSDPVVALSGSTMGTTYSIKVFDSPVLADDLAMAVDAELRRVNSEMSTYLKTSEISRFNDSPSTDWFPVSPQLAMVVQAAIRVSEKSDGAFDVTVGPLVDAWNFGAAQRTGKVPDQASLEKMRPRIGYQKLHVRDEPPGLKKDIAQLRVDLSAIAKGHGVDRVVDRLAELDCKNVFVEIGGEVRVAGSKGGKPWMVGVQRPDVGNLGDQNSLLFPYPIGTTPETTSMATSGDYRNFFEVDGVRYSHTIDPVTLHPIVHDLASVTVIASDCMTADAWATAINVMGVEKALPVIQSENLSTFLVSRSDEQFSFEATGELLPYKDTASQQMAASNQPITLAVQETEATAGSSRLIPMMIVTALALGLVVVFMSVGVLFGRKSISGSCGGIASMENEDGHVSCSLCSNPADACKELREKMNQKST